MAGKRAQLKRRRRAPPESGMNAFFRSTMEETAAFARIA
jgi:hypothetical protein